MMNAEKFKQAFGIYATELWSMSEEDFLVWLNAEAKTEDWIPCKEEDTMSETLTDTNVGNIEYISKQDAVKKCGEWYVEEGSEEGFIGTVRQMLDMFSPADVVQVVRCQNCEEYKVNYHWCRLHETEMSLTDFCSYGERREE